MPSSPSPRDRHPCYLCHVNNWQVMGEACIGLDLQKASECIVLHASSDIDISSVVFGSAKGAAVQSREVAFFLFLFLEKHLCTSQSASFTAKTCSALPRWQMYPATMASSPRALDFPP